MTIQTGIHKLDQALSGGITEGSSVIVLSNPGIDSMSILNQILYENLQKEKNCFVYIDDCPPDEFIRNLSEKNDWDLNKFADLHYIDGFSAKTGIKSKEKYMVEDANSIIDISKTIDMAIRENKENSILIFKEFDKSILTHGGNKSLELLDKIVSNSINTQTTTFISIVDWDFSKEFIEEVTKRCEYVIKIKNKEEIEIIKSKQTNTN